jgi:hypothetical protein
LVQEKKVDWEIFKLGSLSLSRFDVYYFEKINDSDESSVKYFLQDCVKNLEEKRKNISYSLSYGKKRGGYLLRIGSRQSSKHLRIYQKRNGLEFELEIKKQETKTQEKLEVGVYSHRVLLPSDNIAHVRSINPYLVEIMLKLKMIHLTQIIAIGLINYLKIPKQIK